MDEGVEAGYGRQIRRVGYDYDQLFSEMYQVGPTERVEFRPGGKDFR